jgi:hypothetical protein
VIDVLVLGTGRSGTTVVCEVLAKEYGICFGHAGIGEMARNGKQRVYEDAEAKDWLHNVVRSPKPMSVLEFRRRIQAQHEAHGCTKPRGLKLLELTMLTPRQLQTLGATLVVRTYRDFDSCLRSWHRETWRKKAEETIKEREAALKRIEQSLPNVRYIEVDPEKRVYTHEEIVEIIGPWTSGS